MAGTLVLDTLQNGAGTASTSADNVIRGCAKVWVNFNGTSTVAIRASYNVSSITDNGTGNYTVNFTNALTDANYAALVTGDIGGGGDFAIGCTDDSVARTTTAVRVRIGNTAGAAADSNVVSVTCFR